MKSPRYIVSRLISRFGKLPKLTLLFSVVEVAINGTGKLLLFVGNVVQNIFMAITTFRLENLRTATVNFLKRHVKKFLITIPIFMLVTGAVAFLLLRSKTQQEPDILFASGEMILSAEWEIIAGDAWQVTVEVEDGSPGQAIQMIIMNGLQRHDKMLQLGSGGIAVLRIPEATLNYAGQSLIIAQAGNMEIRDTLTILPDEPRSIESLTTANTLTAYGQGLGMIMSFAVDGWGNPVSDNTPLNINIRYPDSSQTENTYETRTGFVWDWFPSASLPGRTRLTFSIAEIHDSMEIDQKPGTPTIMLVEATPDCLLNDERDVITLTATIMDSQGNLVTDGTLIRFEWLDGFGTTSVINGVATLRVPAPDTLGLHRYRAVAGNVFSDPAVVRVARGDCAP